MDAPSRFDAHLDATGLSLVLERTGDVDTRKSVNMHFNYDLFSEILKDVAKPVSKIPQVDIEHRKALAQWVTLFATGVVRESKI